MAVITKYIVVRDGVELDEIFTDKKEAETYDKMLDAAQDLVALIEQGNLQLDIDTKNIEAVSIHLAKNAPAVTQILKNVKPLNSGSKEPKKSKPQIEPLEAKDKAQEPRAKVKNRA